MWRDFTRTRDPQRCWLFERLLRPQTSVATLFHASLASIQPFRRLETHTRNPKWLVSCVQAGRQHICTCAFSCCRCAGIVEIGDFKRASTTGMLSKASSSSQSTLPLHPRKAQQVFLVTFKPPCEMSTHSRLQSLTPTHTFFFLIAGSGAVARTPDAPSKTNHRFSFLRTRPDMCFNSSPPLRICRSQRLHFPSASSKSR